VFVDLNRNNIFLFVMGKRCVFSEVEKYLKCYYVNFMLQVVKNNYILLFQLVLIFTDCHCRLDTTLLIMWDIWDQISVSYHYLVLCCSSHSQIVEI